MPGVVARRRSAAPFSPPESFARWRAATLAADDLPVIAVAGSRGKSTVVRLVDEMLRRFGLRTAVWTDQGVEIEGVRQRGELVPWNVVERRLAEGTLDVAVREVAWSIVPTAGFRRESYPIVAVTNVCANREACLIHGEAKLAAQAMPTLMEAVDRNGVVVLNGEDYAVSGDEAPIERGQILVGLNDGSPLMRTHLDGGGFAGWIESDRLRMGQGAEATVLCRRHELGFALGGSAGFELHNALTAAAVAVACGVPTATIIEGLRAFRSTPVMLPGSFNVLDIRGVLLVVDRPEPSWFLKPVLRSLRDLQHRRLISVAGLMSEVPDADLGEVGRLLGRASAALVMHSELEQPSRAGSLRQGVALTDVPPPIVHTPTERRALTRALQMARPRDVVLVLADQPKVVLRALSRLTRPPSRTLLAAD